MSSRLLRLQVEAERAVLVVVQLGEGRLVRTDAVGRQLAGPGAPSVDEGLDLVPEHAAAQTVPRTDDPACVGHGRHGHLQRTALDLPVDRRWWRGLDG